MAGPATPHQTGEAWVKHLIAFARAARLLSSMAKSQKIAHEIGSGDLPGMAVQLWTSIELRIPIGYQNETGFHYGIEFISSLLEPAPEIQAVLLPP